MKNGTASTAEGRDHLSFLIARAGEGEDAAFSELYALTSRKMRKTARTVCARGTEVEDILQDAYLKIWRNAPNFDPDRSSPISWMSVIVRNTAIDTLRLKTLPTTDLDLALLVPEAALDGADDFDYERARPSAAVAGLYRRRKPAIAVGAFWRTGRHHQDLAAAHTGDGAHGMRGLRGPGGGLTGIRPCNSP
jgi:RNA polymerase sigma factor (sigma-70 family)